MESFEEIYQKYQSEGLKILAFPSHTFKQEPLDDEQMAEEYRERFTVTYPVFSKIDVNGEETSSLYQYLKEASSKDGRRPSDIKWNYEKFLIDRQGKLVKRYSSIARPKKIEKDIKKLL